MRLGWSDRLGCFRQKKLELNTKSHVSMLPYWLEAPFAFEATKAKIGRATRLPE